ncbi:hypothetical protein AB0F88_40035 [Streptosporangium sp. NPDC023963]|uniref:hypothetical protein n=1 Tax=Streptosporangium sp. NPDC023963 TaxID=3155608 RepID=UPI0034418675
MSVLRRAWRVLADPPTSEAASFIRVMVPIWALAALLSLVPGWPVPLARLVDVLWLYVVLVVVRQRDEARADARQAERSACT